MSSVPTTSSLAPPKTLSSSIKEMAAASAGLYQLTVRFGGIPAAVKQLRPDVAEAFLGGYQPYARLMGEQGRSIIYKITDVSTDIIKLGWAIQSLSQFLSQHLSDYKDGGFHLLLHFRTKQRFKQAQGDVQLVINESQQLLQFIKQYHDEVNHYIAQINGEIAGLGQGTNYQAKELKGLYQKTQNLPYNELSPAWFQAYYRICYQAMLEDGTPNFKVLFIQKIQHALDEYKQQALAIVNALEPIHKEWTRLNDDLNYITQDLTKVRGAYPKSITILTKVDLKILDKKWQDVHDELTQMESSLVSSPHS